MKTVIRFVTATLFLLGASTASIAQAIEFEAGSENVVAMLAHDADTFTDAIARGVREKGPALNAGQRSTLRHNASGATIAHLEYQPPGNRPRITVYARSGRSIDGVIEKAQGSKGESGGSSTEAGAEVSPNEEARDLGDSRFYPEDTATSLRARNLRRREGWVVQAYADPVNGVVTHGGDAELKALRMLESLFADAPELSGGTLTAYVSQTVCFSCRRAFDDFNREYGVNGKVYYLDPSGLDENSHAASQRLKVLRKSTASTRLSDKSLEAREPARWAETYEPERIARAEAGDLAASEACVP